MHLIYIDESGNTGNNLLDTQQPVFVLSAMIIEERRWQSLEATLRELMEQRLARSGSSVMEVHAAELRKGSGAFEGLAVAERIAFRDAWMDAAAAHDVRLMYRAISKKRYQQWLVHTFGTGVLINPHIAAFALLSRVVNAYLSSLPGKPLGIFISDENKEIVAHVEKAIRELRLMDGVLRLDRIVEKGFFIDSAHSLPVQLCDLFALSLRKAEERRAGLAARSIDDSGIDRAEKLVIRGDEAFADVIKWLRGQHPEQKK